MPYYKPSEYDGRKRCPACGLETVQYEQYIESWNCFNAACGARIETPLPTEVEQQKDDMLPDDQLTATERPFITSIDSSSGYGYNGYEEEATNSTFTPDREIYRGSANDAVKWDNQQRDYEIAKARHIEQQRRAQFYGSNTDLDTETELQRHNRKQLQDRDRKLGYYGSDY